MIDWKVFYAVSAIFQPYNGVGTGKSLYRSTPVAYKASVLRSHPADRPNTVVFYIKIVCERR